MSVAQTTTPTEHAQAKAASQIQDHEVGIGHTTLTVIAPPTLSYPGAMSLPEVAGLPLDIALPQGSPIHEHQTEPFSVSQAIKYSTASLGAQSVFTMFNLGIPLYLESYGASPWLIGLLSNERSLVAALIQPAVGRLSDRTRTRLGRRRPFFLVGIPLMSLSLLALGAHPPFWVMLGVMTGAALFMSIAMDPYMALMADVFPRGHRGRVGGFTGLASAAGTVVFLLLAALFWARWEFGVFALVALLLAGCFAITFLAVKEPTHAFSHLHPQEREVSADNTLTGSKISKAQAIRSALSGLREYGEARKYTVALMLYWAGGGGVAPFITLFAKHSLGADSGASFLLPVGFVATSALLVVPAGYLADRVGKKRIMTAGLVLYALGAVAGSQATGIVEGMGAMALLGAANACTSVMLALLTDLIPANRRGEILGIVSALWSLAQPAGSIVAGLVVDIAAGALGLGGAYRLIFVLAGMVMGASALMLQRVRTNQPLE